MTVRKTYDESKHARNKFGQYTDKIKESRPGELPEDDEDWEGSYNDSIDYSGVDLHGAHIVDTDDTGGNFDYVDLTGATITGSRYDYASFRNAELSDVQAQNLSFDHATFDGANLAGAVLADSSGQYARFSHANLTDAVLDHTDLRHAEFMKADLSGARISSGNPLKSISDMRSSVFDYSAVNPDHASAKVVGLAASGNASMGIRWVDLSSSSMCDMDWRRACIRHTTMHGCDLSGSDLSGARIDSASMRDACMLGVRLNDAYVFGVTFDNAGCKAMDVRGARFERCAFQRAHMSGIIVDAHTAFAQCDLSGADLRGTGLHHDSPQFVGCNLHDTIFDEPVKE